MPTVEPLDQHTTAPELAERGQSETTCSACGSPLDPADRVCVTCGRQRERECFCGVLIPADQGKCPSCGMDWRRAVKIRRRSRSEKIRSRGLLRSAALGACLAILMSGLLNLIVSALAQRSTSDGTVPAAMGERLYYAWYTLAKAMVILFDRLVGGLGSVVVIALMGAVAGILIYVVPARMMALSRKLRRRDKHTRRRRSNH